MPYAFVNNQNLLTQYLMIHGDRIRMSNVMHEIRTQSAHKDNVPGEGLRH